MLSYNNIIILGFLRGYLLPRFIGKGAGLAENSLFIGFTLVLVKYGLIEVERKVVLPWGSANMQDLLFIAISL